jgi:hypothetical protein
MAHVAVYRIFRSEESSLFVGFEVHSRVHRRRAKALRYGSCGNLSGSNDFNGLAEHPAVFAVGGLDVGPGAAGGLDV